MDIDADRPQTPPNASHYDDSLTQYDALRAAIVAAWNAVPEIYLAELLKSMSARRQAVIDANGQHTRY